jgi:hypothetical protein
MKRHHPRPRFAHFFESQPNSTHLRLSRRLLARDIDTLTTTMDYYYHASHTSYQEEKKECEPSDDSYMIAAEANAEYLAAEALRLASEARRTALRLAELRANRERRCRSVSVIY